MSRYIKRSQNRVNEQDALSGVLAMVSGGRIGSVPNTCIQSVGLVGIRATAIGDFKAYETNGEKKGFIVRMPNNALDSIDACQVLFPAIDITNLNTVYTASGPLWTAANIGSFPLAAVIPRDYPIEAKFGNGYKAADEGRLITTMLQAGSTPLQGTITTGVVPSPVARTSLTKAGLMSNVGDVAKDMFCTIVAEGPVVIGVGDGDLSKFSGNFVDLPDSYEFNRTINTGTAIGVNTLVGYAVPGGGIPDYVTSAIKVNYSYVVTTAAVPAGTTLAVTTFLNADYACVNSTGTMIINSPSSYSVDMFAGPIAAGVALRTIGQVRMINPFKELGYTGYLIGVRAVVNMVNAGTNVAVPPLSGSLNVNFTMPNQNSSSTSGDKLIILENYVGPFTVNHTQHWMARPEVANQADFKDQLIVPYPSYLKDAVQDSVYTLLGASMGRAFPNEASFTEYLKRLDEPEYVYRGLAEPEPGVIPDFIDPAGEKESEYTARSPVLQAARYRVEENMPHSQYSASLWSGLAGIGRNIGKKVLPALVPEITNSLTSLLGGDYQATRYTASSSLPVYGSATYHAARAEDTKEELGVDGDWTGEEEESLDPLDWKVCPGNVKDYISSYKHLESLSSESMDPQFVNFLCQAKYIECHTPYSRIRLAMAHMNGSNLTSDCYEGKCSKPCCSPSRIATYYASSKHPKDTIEVFKRVPVPVLSQPAVQAFDHQRNLATVLNRAGYNPDTPGANTTLVAAGVACPKVSCSGFNVDFNLPDDEEPVLGGEPVFESEEEPEEDGLGEVEAQVIDKALAPKLKKQAKVESKDSIIIASDQPFSQFSTDDYGKLTKEDLQKMMLPVTNGFYHDLLHTGAGPVVSGKAASRIAGLVKNNNNYPVSAAHFALVSKSHGLIGTIVVSDLPLNRRYQQFDGVTAIKGGTATLKSTYRLGAVTRGTRVGNKIVVTQYHVGNEFNPNTIKDIQRVVDIYHSMSSPPPTPKYISIVLNNLVLAPGDVDGNSFSLALLCALVGLPCGPTMTGAVNGSGEITKVGELQTKVSMFYKNPAQVFGPVLFPSDQLSFPESENFELMCNLNSWPYIMEHNIYQVKHFRDVLSFFSGGGYHAWLKRIDPTGNKIATMDKISDAVVGAQSVVKVVQLLQETAAAVAALKANKGLSKAEKVAEMAELKTRYETYEKQRAMNLEKMVGEFEYKAPEGMKKAKNAKFIDFRRVANERQSQYLSPKGKKMAVKKKDSTPTRERGTILKYPRNFPIGNLAGGDAPAKLQFQLWAIYNLKGEFMNDGLEWAYRIDLSEATARPEIATMDDLMQEFSFNDD